MCFHLLFLHWLTANPDKDQGRKREAEMARKDRQISRHLSCALTQQDAHYPKITLNKAASYHIYHQHQRPGSFSLLHLFARRHQPAPDSPPPCFITASQTLLNIYHLIVLKPQQTAPNKAEHGTVPILIMPQPTHRVKPPH